MIQVRPSENRGGGDHGWLKTHHTFSFGDFWDPKWMGFRSLRVINEDWVAPNTGFPTHPHRDMEIITYVLEGKLEHKDSLGTGSVILPGDGRKFLSGSSALMRTSMAAPRLCTSACVSRNGSPCAMRIISRTRSMPVIISVIGCSTWMRVFISMKKNSPVASS